MNFPDLIKPISTFYYGWRMIGVVSSLRIFGGGLHQYGFTVFFLPVTQDLGLTRAMTSLAFSLARAEGAIESPVVGYLLDRYGPKPMMLAATTLAGLGYILFAFVNIYTTFLIVYLGVISLAFTAGFVHAPTVVAGAVYDRTQSYATVFTGMTIALLIAAGLTALLIKPWANLRKA